VKFYQTKPSTVLIDSDSTEFWVLVNKNCYALFFLTSFMFMYNYTWTVNSV